MKGLLVNFERSGRVREAFRAAGCNAVSCDYRIKQVGVTDFHKSASLLLEVWETGRGSPKLLFSGSPEEVAEQITMAAAKVE